MRLRRRPRRPPEWTATGLLLAESKKAMLLVNGDTEEIVQANPVAEAFWGPNLIGQKITALIPEAKRENHKKYVAAYMVNPQEKPVRGVSTVLADGKEMPVEIGLTPMVAWVEGRTTKRMILVDIEPA